MSRGGWREGEWTEAFLSASFFGRKVALNYLSTGSEGDYFRFIDNHLSPLGMVAFPIMPFLCLAGLAVWLGYSRFFSARPRRLRSGYFDATTNICFPKIRHRKGSRRYQRIRNSARGNRDLVV